MHRRRHRENVVIFAEYNYQKGIFMSKANNFVPDHHHCHRHSDTLLRTTYYIYIFSSSLYQYPILISMSSLIFIISTLLFIYMMFIADWRTSKFLFHYSSLHSQFRSLLEKRKPCPCTSSTD